MYQRITWKMFDYGCKEIAKWVDKQSIKVDNVYGIPRGGLVVAVRLSHLLDLPLTRDIGDETLIVDDIIDSGKTMQRIAIQGINPTACLVWYEKSIFVPDKYVWKKKRFVFFPWETKKTAKIDYLR